MKRLLFKLGVRLVTPSICRQIQHYQDAALTASETGAMTSCVHYTYIVVGLKRACQYKP